MYYVMIDEVQMLEDFVDVLNGFLHIDNLDVYVTGSNAKFLSSDIVTEFRGRGVQIHLQPLSFKEIKEKSNDDISSLWRDYIYYGGLRNTLLNFRQVEPTHIMENIIYNQLIGKGYKADVGCVTFYKKDNEGKTIRTTDAYYAKWHYNDERL